MAIPQPPGVDLSKAVPVDSWEASPDPAKVILTITDKGKNTVLRVTVTVQSVLKVGVDPNNGLPIYNPSIAVQTSLVSMDASLREKLPTMPGSSAPGNAYR